MRELTFDLVPQGAESAFRISNLPDESFRELLASTPNESSPLTTKIKFLEVHHGRMTYDKKPCSATLVVLEMNFISSNQKRRYQSVTTTMEFFDKLSPDSKHTPVVVKLSPQRTHWLHKTTRERATKYGVTAGAQAGGGPASLDLGAHWEVEASESMNSKATLTGRSYPSRDYTGNTENSVAWSMSENEHENVGIPSFLQTAVLLRTTEPREFIAKIRVNSEVDVYSAARRAVRFTTDEDKLIEDVTFTPGRVQLQRNSVTGITEHQLEHMELLPIDNYFRVNLSEQDNLLPDRVERKLEPMVQATDKPSLVDAEPAVVDAKYAELRNKPAVLNTAEGGIGVSLTGIMEALNKAAEAAAHAAEAAGKSAEAAGLAATAAVKVAEAVGAVTSAANAQQSQDRQ